MRRWFISTMVAATLCASVAGPCLAADAPARKIRVFVSLPPQAYFAERVGGGRVEVETLVGAGRDPHTYNPTPKQMTDLARAGVYFIIGLPFEDAIVAKIKSTMKNLTVVDTREGIALRRMESEEAETGEKGHHHHEGDLDPHTWMSPLLVKRMAQTMRDALIKIDPSGKGEYEANAAAFSRDLEQLHDRIAKALAPMKGGEIFVFHPGFGYLADAYGLKQVPVEIEGKEPSPRQIADLIKRAKASGAKVIFVQPEFSPKSAQAIASAIGGAVVPLDALGRDYIRNMDDMAAKIEKALRK